MGIINYDLTYYFSIHIVCLVLSFSETSGRGNARTTLTEIELRKCVDNVKLAYVTSCNTSVKLLLWIRSVED